MSGKQIVTGIIVLIALYAAFDSMFIVDVRERALVLQLGDIVASSYDPGLHFKLPFVQKAISFDDRILTLTGRIERVLTSENKNVSVEYYVLWEIVDTVDYYLSSQGSEARARRLIIEIVENDLLAQFSQRTLKQAIDDEKNEIVSTIQVLANQDMDRLGIHIVDVRITALELPAPVTESVYQRMRSARQEVIKALRASGAAAAQKIRAEAERKRTVILSEARRKAQKIRGKAEARAADIFAEAVSGHLDFYSFWRSMEMYRDSVGQGDVLVLEPGGELFQHFNPSAKAE